MEEKFHQRFNIQVPIEEAKRRFINRIRNSVLSYNAFNNFQGYQSFWNSICDAVANRLGEPVQYGHDSIQIFTGDWKWHKTLQAVEAVYDQFDGQRNFHFPFTISKRVGLIMQQAELDLGIRWTDGRFLPSGASELDEVLINDSLRWIREKGLLTVQAPFEKSLSHLLQARAKPELLSDVITDAYEALEALAKIVTGRDQTLDANQDAFLAKICASDEYKQILNECLRKYRSFAHKFRHGAASPEKKPSIGYAEAESFVYLTGLFIRLTISAGFSSVAGK